MYVAERALEVRSLCDPRVKECLTGNDVELRSFEGLTFTDVDDDRATLP
jgi:predicted glycoside hydrolase/deacetylase ChbG (UPF0249 family)